MMFNIYKITDKFGRCYVGQTKNCIKTRLIQHRCTKILNMHWSSAKVELIERTKIANDREIYWISKIGTENISTGGPGSPGFSKPIEQQIYASKCSHEKRWSSMPKFIAIKKDTGEIFGPFQGYEIAGKELNHNSDLLGDYIRRGRHTRYYYLKYEVKK